MNLTRKVLLLFLVSFINGCAFYPKVEADQDYMKKCQMVTRKMTLESKSLGAFDCSDTTPELCLVVLIGVPAASLVVSGSVVLAGNTLHWMEYHGRCEQGLVKKALSQF